MPVLSPQSLTSFSQSLFEAAGVPSDEAFIVARGLVEANVRGHDSHGVLRIPQYLKVIAEGELKPAAPFTIFKETASLVAADGNWGLGQVQAHRLLERTMAKAFEVGIAAGTLKNCGHIGRLGEFAETAAARQMALIATVNSHGYARAVAPPGGKEGRIATNPLCMGVPSQGEPIILDIGTSVCAEGKIRVALNKSEKIPFGWIIDHLGKPTNEPLDFYREPRGTILPLGGAQAYKGFGIGLLLDMLAGGLSGAPCSDPDAPLIVGNAVLFIVLDIEHFAGANHFLREVSNLADHVRSCPRIEGVSEIMIPGDPERKELEQRKRSGVPVDDGTWNQLTKLALEWKVALPVQAQGETR